MFIIIKKKNIFNVVLASMIVEVASTTVMKTTNPSIQQPIDSSTSKTEQQKKKL